MMYVETGILLHLSTLFFSFSDFLSTLIPLYVVCLIAFNASGQVRRVVFSYKRKYEHKILDNRLDKLPQVDKLPQEKVRLGELTVPTWS